MNFLKVLLLLMSGPICSVNASSFSAKDELNGYEPGASFPQVVREVYAERERGRLERKAWRLEEEARQEAKEEARRKRNSTGVSSSNSSGDYHVSSTDGNNDSGMSIAQLYREVLEEREKDRRERKAWRLAEEARQEAKEEARKLRMASRASSSGSSGEYAADSKQKMAALEAENKALKEQLEALRAGVAYHEQ